MSREKPTTSTFIMHHERCDPRQDMNSESAQADTDEFRFAQHGDEMPTSPDQARLDCLAYCVASQQRAGFRTYIDAREAKCASCGASGFNTGWGYWRFSCGLEITTVDGEECEPCAALSKAGGPNVG